jgi:hypothetical protein
MFNCYNNELRHDVEGKSIWGYYNGVSYAIEQVFYVNYTNISRHYWFNITDEYYDSLTYEDFYDYYCFKNDNDIEFKKEYVMLYRIGLRSIVRNELFAHFGLETVLAIELQRKFAFNSLK